MDLFDRKNISSMLIGENVPPFADEAYLYELKWDRERCVAFLDPKAGTDLRNKWNSVMLPKVPELSCCISRPENVVFWMGNWSAY